MEQLFYLVENGELCARKYTHHYRHVCFLYHIVPAPDIITHPTNTSMLLLLLVLYSCVVPGYRVALLLGHIGYVI